MATRPKLRSGQSSLLSTDLLAYYRQASRSLLTVVDVETTGSLAHKSRVIEVSVLQASLEEGIQRQQTYLINPRSRIPWPITQVTGITQEMIEDAEPPDTVWPKCRSWLNEGILTAHNLAFDYSFLQSEYRRLGNPFVRSVSEQLCTVLLSRILLADLPSRSLPNLVNHFGFGVGTSHRAEADTLACWLLAEKLLTQIQQEPDEVILQRFSQQWMRLQDAAALLKCPKKKAQEILEQAKVDYRLSQSNKGLLYRRGEVEGVFWERKQKI
ncbi:MAG: 3'-5' exonuclease [Leptolyngbyaceae cyanobacterium MO_188.B28]|nr:3'-5' exonuclease [Leptolyngbyaceae cyanobacterium MO_188.B28]